MTLISSHSFRVRWSIQIGRKILKRSSAPSSWPIGTKTKLQDTTASVPSMLAMFDALGSSNKQKQAFPLAASHAIITPGLSSEVEAVEKATIKFLNEIY